MSSATPFPQRLTGRVFTVHQARAEGVSAGRLRASDVRWIARGLYAQGLDGPPGEAAVVAGLNLLYASTWASHTTAARILGLYLPRRLAADSDLHLSRHRRMPPLKIRGLINHRVTAVVGDVGSLQAPPHAPPDSRVRVSSFERTWLDLAGRLDLTELVVMGDQLVRIPRPDLEGRSRPWATRETLRAALREHPGAPALTNARAATEHVRVGSDSPSETRLRLSLMAAGLPEPELQVRLDPCHRHSPTADLGYRDSRIAIQYDGYHHRSPRQLATDNRRDLAFTQAGWTYLKFDWQDAQHGFGRAIALVGAALAGRVAWGQVPSVQ